jgi:hypothetical protein
MVGQRSLPAPLAKLKIWLSVRDPEVLAGSFNRLVVQR